MKNSFWRWVRLREGREIFKASTQLRHADGTMVTVSVEGANAEYVSAVMNGIKAKYEPIKQPKVEPPNPWTAFETLMRRK